MTAVFPSTVHKLLSVAKFLVTLFTEEYVSSSITAGILRYIS